MEGISTDIEEEIYKDLINSHWKRSNFEKNDPKKVTFLKIVKGTYIKQRFILFCFIQVDMNESSHHTLQKYVLFEASLKDQCLKQGYSELDYDTLWEPLSERSYECEFNEPYNESVSFIFPISTQLSINIKLSISETLEESLNSLSQYLYQDLMKQIFSGIFIQSNKIKKQEEIIKEKDNVIQYLKENLINLGGTTLINKWAPCGSTNYEYLQRCNLTRLKSEINEDSMKTDIDNLMNEYFECIGKPLDKKLTPVKRSNDTISQDSQKNNHDGKMTQNKRMKRSFGRVKVKKRE